MPFSNTAKNSMLDAITPNRLSLHNGDPGSAGTANEISGNAPDNTAYARQTCSFAAAASGVRNLSADVTFAGPSQQAVTHVGVWFWNGSSHTFLGSFSITGDSTFNVEGRYIIKASGPTRLRIVDS